MNVVSEKSHRIQVSGSIATGYEHLSSHRVRASQQSQGTRVSRQLQGVSFSAAAGCESLGISLDMSISAMI